MPSRLLRAVNWRARQKIEAAKNWLERYFASGQARRMAWYSYMNGRAVAHNLALYRPHLVWLNDAELIKLRRTKIRGIPDDRLFLLYSTARSVRELAGHVAECGVREGRSAFFMLNGLGDGHGKDFHLFDSFEGVSSPTSEDLRPDGTTHWRKGLLAAPEANLRDFTSTIQVHKGWIPERFADVADEQFCLVHMDVDLFQPTSDSVAFFYPRMVPNGIMVCDDYGFESCPGAKRAIDEFFSDKPEHVLHLPSGQCLIVKV